MIRGLEPEGNDLEGLLKKLKDVCGAGGAIKDDSLEIQGDQVERVREVLSEIGFRVKG